MDGLHFSAKSRTDLYLYAKKRIMPTALAVARGEKWFVVCGDDLVVRVFEFWGGCVWREFDAKGEIVMRGRMGVSAEELGRRLAREREVLSDEESLRRVNAVFDGSNRFLLYSSVVGVHVVEMETKNEVRVYGEREAAERFLTVAYMEGREEEGGLLLTNSFESQRVYLFNSDEVGEERDVFNERPMVKGRERALGGVREGEMLKRRVLAKRATLHTTNGDVMISLLDSVAPKAVENFETHARNGYFNQVVFHRVIKGFMIQTGDPEGDGAGGESIWGGEFEDEIDDKVTHETGTVSMANAGPNTNGSVRYCRREVRMGNCFTFKECTV